MMHYKLLQNSLRVSSACLLCFLSVGPDLCDFYGWCVLYQKFFDRVRKVILSGSRPSEAHR